MARLSSVCQEVTLRDLRAEADWLTAVECFYGVGLGGGSTLAFSVPLIKAHDTGGAGMSPQRMCLNASRKSLRTCESGEGTRRTFTHRS